MKIQLAQPSKVQLQIYRLQSRDLTCSRGLMDMYCRARLVISHHFILERSTSRCHLNWYISEVHCKTTQPCCNGKLLMKTVHRISMWKEVSMAEAMIQLVG